MTTALVLVDLQNDFMPGGALAVAKGDEIVPVANGLMSRYEIVVATLDWHPADHGSFAANHPGGELYEFVDLNGLQQVLWPVHCVQHTIGAAFHSEVHIAGIDEIFVKGTDRGIDSYSGFFDRGRRQSTGMAEWLRDQGVGSIDLMGLATDYCVKVTAIDGAEIGFATRLITAGCRAIDLDPDDGARALADMRDAGVEIIDRV